MEKENALIEQLKSTGMELWLRAESWKSALEHIQKLNTDPMIDRFINRTLKQENY